MGVVDGRQLDLLPADVLPDVELGEVREREGAQVLARPHAALVELPELGSLTLGVPLAEGVAERQHPLLGPGLVLVAAGPAEGGVEACSLMASSSVVVCSRLREATGPGSATRPWSMESCTLATRSRAPSGLDLRVAVVEHLGEVVPGVDVEHREGDLAGLERLGRQVQQDGRVLAAAEEQHRPLGLGRHLADDEDGQRLEQVEVAQRVAEGPTRAVTDASVWPGRPASGAGRRCGPRCRGLLRCPWDPFKC